MGQQLSFKSKNRGVVPGVGGRGMNSSIVPIWYRAADDLGHRDVTRNLSSSEIVSWFEEVQVETLR